MMRVQLSDFYGDLLFLRCVALDMTLIEVGTAGDALTELFVCCVVDSKEFFDT